MKALQVLCTFLAIVLLCGPTSVWAQNVPPVVDPSDELERERENERRQEQLDNFNARKKPIAKTAPVSQDSGDCVQVREIKIDGDLWLQKFDYTQQLNAIWAPRCMTKTDISSIMRDVNKAYIDAGYITTRTYIKKQNFNDGVLYLYVKEGFIEGIEVVDADGKTLPHRRVLFTFPIASDELLQLRDFEQGVDQINRLKSAKAQMKFKPGELAGGSVALITIKDENQFRGNVSWTNLGSPSTGEDQLRVALAKDNLLNINDTWNLSYAGSRDSNAASLDTSVPLGYLTLSGGISASDYLIPLTDFSELFGDALTLTGSAHYIFARDSNTKTYVKSTLQWRKTRRFINSFELTPQTFTTLKLSTGHIIDREKAKTFIDMGVGFGLDWFEATSDDGGLGTEDPHAQFMALEGGITHAVKPKDWGKWSVSLRGKYSETALYGPEQTPLGSRSTIRSFETAPLFADQAAYMRFDVNPNMPKPIGNTAKKVLGNTLGDIVAEAKPYAFFDAGLGHNIAADETDWVAGFGGGLKMKYKKMKFELGVEQPIAEDNKFRDFNAHGFARVSMDIF